MLNAMKFLIDIETEGTDFKKDLSRLELEEQLEILKSSCEEFCPEDEIYKKFSQSIKNNKPLNIKFGVDPLSMDLHIGDIPPLVLSGKLQRMGHKITLIIGDVTALIGDPFRSWKAKELSRKNLDRNLKQLKNQLDNFLDFSKIGTVYNSSWLNDIKFPELIELMKKVKIFGLFKQGEIEENLDYKEDITYAKLIYPFLMGMDSIEIKPDIEIGNSNQINSFRLCRHMMEAVGIEPEAIMTTFPIIQDDYFSIYSKPIDIFKNVTKLDKDSILNWYRLLTEVSPQKLNEIKQCIDEDKIDLQALKEVLAKIIVSRVYNHDQSELAYIEYIKDMVKNSETQEVAMLSGNVKVGEFIAASTDLTLAETQRIICSGGVNALSCDGKCLVHLLDCEADIKTVSFDKFYVIVSDRLILSIKK